MRLNGKWSVTNNSAIEEQAVVVPWNFYELLNYNSIISINPINNFSHINYKINLYEKEKNPVEMLISFAITSESKAWYYHFYGFRISGGFWGINKVSFIYSDRLDKTKPYSEKYNSFIKELASSNYKIKYNKIYNYQISFEGSNVTLYINDEKVLSAPFPEKSYEGRIAISSKNMKIAIDKIEVKQNDKIIFQDDFDKESIFTRIVKAQKVPINSVEVEKPE